jgi:Sulfotransferase domain
MMHIYRLIHAKAARSKIRVPRVWFWHLGLKPQDIFLASYPRSGSTWLRFMLFQILTGEDPGFRRIDQRIPEIQMHRGVPPVLPGGGRLIKTHEQYRKDYTKAVFLIRDLRDVLVSCYVRSAEAGLAQLVSKGDFDSFLLSFLRGRALQQGSWQQHSRSWLDSPLVRNGNLMVVRYEDLRRDSEKVIGQLLNFLGVTPDFRIVRKAIENNSLQQMRAKEDQAIRVGEQSALLGCHKSPGGEDGRFIRKGSVGGWRNRLTDAHLRIIDQYAGDMLARLGYESGLLEPRARPATITALSA